MTLPNTNHYG
jgi:hypothetical protein